MKALLRPVNLLLLSCAWVTACGNNCIEMCETKCERGHECNCGDSWDSDQDLKQCKKLCHDVPPVENPSTCEIINEDIKLWGCTDVCLYLGGVPGTNSEARR